MPQPERSADEQLDIARSVLTQESEAIARLSQSLGAAFLDAVERLHACRGMVVVTGMGKAGLIGAKISATLASTGTRSLFLHPAEAVHGDLGRIYHEDLVLALSRSGSTEEVVRLLEPIKRLGARLIAVTESPDSPLARHSDVCLEIGRVVEACPLGLAPTTSTSVMLALGDALAMTIMNRRNFSKDNFARFHPAGALGRRLLTVADVMRRGQDHPQVPAGSSVKDALQAMTVTRAGAVTVVDGDGCLRGFYTDGDLRRQLLDAKLSLDGPIDDLMNPSPWTIGPDQLATEAVHLMKEKQFDQLLVVDGDRRPIGLLDVQDLIQVGLV